MTVTFNVELRGEPLRQTYVSHFDFFRVPQTLFFRTDNSGRVRISNEGLANVTTDPTGPQGPIMIRVHAQNSVVRVLDGNSPIPIEVSQEFRVSTNSTVNINTNAEQQDHFRIMELCRDAYQKTLRDFSPFNSAGRRTFPFGQNDSVQSTRDKLPRIEVVYPDNSAAQLAYVEPISIGTGAPLIHIKDKNYIRPRADAPDARLFGNSQVFPSLIPHELAHALYFCLMSPLLRASVEAQYLSWITSRLVSGLPPFHNANLATTSFVAWIECLGIFAENYFFFQQLNIPAVTGVTLRQAFFRNELSNSPVLDEGSDGEDGNRLNGYLQVGRLDNARRVVPLVTGSRVEGALYGAIFLDFARRAGLREAVGRYLNSTDNNVLSFDDFRNLVIGETDFDDDMLEIVATWQL
jgi:hypothetical protein